MIAVALSASHQADNGKHISVTETGKLEVEPDQIEIAGVVSGNAEIASDTLKKCRDNQRRAQETIKGLRFEFEFPN